MNGPKTKARGIGFKTLRWFAVVLPMLPLLLFTIPHAMTLFDEPTDPWYTKYTSLPWLITAMYVYPATVIAKSLGASPLTPLHVFCMLAYTGAISYGIYRLTEKKGPNQITGANHGQR